MAMKRNDPEYRERERLKDRERRAKKRQNLQVRENERDKDRIYKQRQRLKNGRKADIKVSVGESSDNDFGNANFVSTVYSISESDVTKEQAIMSSEGPSHIYEIGRVENTEQLAIPGHCVSKHTVQNEESYVIVQNVNSDMEFCVLPEKKTDSVDQTMVICVNTEPQRINPSCVINNESSGNKISCISYNDSVNVNNITGFNQTVCFKETCKTSQEITIEQSKLTDECVKNKNYKLSITDIPKSDNSISKGHGCVELNSNMDAERKEPNSTDPTTRNTTKEEVTIESETTAWEQNENAILGLIELGADNSSSYVGDNVITLYNEGT